MWWNAEGTPNRVGIAVERHGCDTDREGIRWGKAPRRYLIGKRPSVRVQHNGTITIVARLGNVRG